MMAVNNYYHSGCCGSDDTKGIIASIGREGDNKVLAVSLRSMGSRSWSESGVGSSFECSERLSWKAKVQARGGVVVRSSGSKSGATSGLDLGRCC